MIIANKVVLFISLLLLIFIFSCVPKQLEPGEKTPPEKIAPVEKPGSADAEWAKILPVAKKEGKLLMYTTTQAEVRIALSEGFKKRTGLEIEIITGRGGEIVTKLLAERRAGLYLSDFYLGGTTTLFTEMKPKGVLRPLMPELFLPEVLDTRLWFKGELPFMDKEKMVMQTRFMAGGSVMDVIFKPDQVIKPQLISWYDVLQPQFKGKMNMQDPTTAGKGGKFINKALTYFGLDWDYMKALVRQEPVITREQRSQIEWVARGKHILALNPDHDTFFEFKRAGTLLDFAIFKETKDVLGGGSSGIALIANAPHPYAAKLFLNWFLGKEGQTIFAQTYHIQSAREDTPTDHLPEYNIRKPNVDYAVETEEFVTQEEKFRPMTLEIFGPLLK